VAAIMAQVELAGPGFGFDARTGLVVDMVQAGVLDAAATVREAASAAISAAALALTTDVLIHRNKPAEGYEP
jgi:chaperonin GroEL